MYRQAGSAAMDSLENYVLNALTDDEALIGELDDSIESTLVLFETIAFDEDVSLPGSLPSLWSNLVVDKYHRDSGIQVQPTNTRVSQSTSSMILVALVD